MVRKKIKNALVLMLLTTSHFSSSYSYALELSKSEQNYLKNKAELTFCTDSNWMPFEDHNSKGEYIGVAAEYVSYFEKQIGIQFVHIPTASWEETLELAKQGECDFIPFFNSSKHREKFLLLSDAYFASPTVFVTNDDHSPIADFGDLGNVRVAIVKGYIYEELLKPFNHLGSIVYTNSSQDAFLKVVNGDAAATIEAIHSASYIISHNGFTNLKIAGVSNFVNQFKVGISGNDTTLLAIMNKTIATIPQEKHTQFLRQWVSIKFDNTYYLPKSLYFVLVCLFILLGGGIGYILRQNALLRITSQKDSLTGLMNRRAAEFVLKQQISILSRYERPFSVIMIDVDFFKSVNDTYGHVVGDKVLKKIAEILQESLRESDCCTRWGGEEFLVVCPETEGCDIERVSEVLRIAIEYFEFETANRITVSLGATEAYKYENIDKIIDRCDRALYQAKNAGRNRSVLLTN